MSAHKEPIRVLVVDDHPLLREGVAAALEAQQDLSLVGEAANGGEALRLFQALRPDVTLMDLQMPGMDGVTAIRAIRAQFPQARIAVLTTYQGDVRALYALQAGATGYLLKSSLRHELLTAIRALAAGRRYIPAEVAEALAAQLQQEVLTPREIEVLQRVALGEPNKRIAAQLTLSEDTVKGHLKNILEKMGAHNRTHAVSLAIQRGIVRL